MSSTTSIEAAMAPATTTTTTNGTTGSSRQTYWCHECDMSVSLLTSTSTPSAPPLLCPYCHSDFLEEMDSNPNSNSNSNSSSNIISSFLDSPFSDHTLTDSSPADTFPFPPPTDDDNYLLNSPYLQRLIQHLSNSESDDSTLDTSTTPVPAARYQSPASKSAVEAIPTVTISPPLLDLDPIILCAVCKDHFVVHDEAKQLPCKHMYHPDCILPWLSQHNSCPVCRYQLPTEDGSKERRRSRAGAVRFGELMEDDSVFGFGNTLRHIARRHRLVLPGSQHRDLDSFILSQTQVAEAEPQHMDRANSVETVSSWPIWPVEGVAAGSGDGEVGASATDGDTVMSEARVSGSVSTNLR